METQFFQAALFDCDGVLVDSEGITNRVLWQMLNESGWALAREECMRRFVGKMVISQKDVIEAHTGKPLTEAWMAEFYRRRNDALAQEVEAVGGAAQMVARIRRAVGGRIACASGADLGKLNMQLGKVGLLAEFAGQLYSGHDTPANKPAPDVYLAAAAGLGVAPHSCVVIEDSPTGVRAGAAAGATVFAFCPPAHHSSAEILQAAGAAQVFSDLAALTDAVVQRAAVQAA